MHRLIMDWHILQIQIVLSNIVRSKLCIIDLAFAYLILLPNLYQLVLAYYFTFFFLDATIACTLLKQEIGLNVVASCVHWGEHRWDDRLAS